MSEARGGVSLSKPYPRIGPIWKICSSVSA